MKIKQKNGLKIDDFYAHQQGTGLCRRWLRKLKAAARVTQEKTGEGRKGCERKANPSPLFISLTRQPNSHFPLNFAIIANLANPASPPALQNF